MRVAIGIAGVALALMFAGGVSAGESAEWDSLELQNGRVITGSVTPEGRGYRVRRPLGSIWISADEVRRVALQHDSVDELERMEREGYPLGSVNERLQYAELLTKLRSRSRAKEAYEGVLRVDPTHVGAHLALGHVLHQGVWKTFAESQRDKGFVLYQGGWVLPAERDRLLAQARRDAARQAAHVAARAQEARRSRAAARARAAAAALARQDQRRDDERQALVERAARAEAQLAEARRAAEAPVVVFTPRRPYNSRSWPRRGGSRFNGRHNDQRHHDRSSRRRVTPPTPQPARPAKPATPAKPAAPSGPVIAPPRMRQLPLGAR